MNSNILFESKYKWSNGYWILIIPILFAIGSIFMPGLWLIAFIFNAPLVIAALLHKHYVVTTSKELIVYRCLGLIRTTYLLSEIKSFANLKFNQHNSVCLITKSGKRIRIRSYEMDNIFKFLSLILKGVSHNKREEVKIVLMGELRSNFIYLFVFILVAGLFTWGFCFNHHEVTWIGTLFVLLLWCFVGFYCIYEIIPTFKKIRLFKTNPELVDIN